MSDGVIFQVNGKDYDITDLTGDEVEQIEEEFDCAFAELDFGRAKVRRFVLFPLLKRYDPDLTMDDMKAMKVLKDLIAQADQDEAQERVLDMVTGADGA